MDNNKVDFKTGSMCPTCRKMLEAHVYEENDKIWMKKHCPEHGETLDIYWSDPKSFKRFNYYRVTDKGFETPHNDKINGCPLDCGICKEHHSGTYMLIMDITNRCNLRCPVCFAKVNEGGHVFEPTMDEIRFMLENAKKVNPAPLTTIQFSGGEPTVREDLPEILALAKEVGYTAIYINTNGIKLAKSVDYCKKLIDSGLTKVYLQFDGTTPDVYLKTRGFDILPIKMKAIENMRQAGFKSKEIADNCFFLVVTVAKGVNDHQLGDIVRFCADNKDVIKTVNFQQVSFMGRMDLEFKDLVEQRITTPDGFRLLEEQTDGAITADDFLPYAFTSKFLHFYNSWKMQMKRFKNVSCHPHCGSHCLTYVDNGKLIPYTRFLDMAGIVDFLDQQATLLDKGTSKLKISYNFVTNIAKFVKTKNLPSDLNVNTFVNLIKEIVTTGERKTVDRLNQNTITVSNMHFMDLYNLDVERTSRCVIHYAVPDGRLIPFCTYNNLYRQDIEKQFGRPVTSSEVPEKVESPV